VDDLEWLLVSVSSAGAPASIRVLAWRRLRSLGAVYLQQSVCLLPDRPPVRDDVERLLARVIDEGGSGRVLRVRLTDPDEQQQLVADFRRASDTEYDDLLGRVPDFMAELDCERGRGRARLVEVEENEADLQRYRDWLAKIEGRDYFHASLRQKAQRAVERCAAELARFEREAFTAETGPGAGAAPAAEPVGRQEDL
jgi:hypothetical protein